MRLKTRLLTQASASATPGIMAAHMSTVTALKGASEGAGVEFIDENGGGPGVRHEGGNIVQSDAWRRYIINQNMD